MKSREADKGGAVVPGQRQRPSSNIDFESKPASVEIRERYAVAINYHFVRPSLNGVQFRVPAAVTPEKLAGQLAALKENFDFCRCRDLADPKTELPESSVLITLDDGASDVVKFAAPVLKQYGVLASVFVCAQPYTEGRVLAVHKIQILMAHLGTEKFRAAFYAELERQNAKEIVRDSLEYANGYNFYPYDNEPVRKLKLDLNYLIPYQTLQPVLDAVFADVFGADGEKEAIKQFYLSLDDLKRLVDDGHELGLHGYDHKVLPRLSFEEQKRNIQANIDFLAPISGKSQLSVAYPYGFCDNATKRALKELDIVTGYSMKREIITPKDLIERWEMPRYDVNDCFDKKDNRINYQVFSSLSTGDLTKGVCQ